MNFNFRKYNSFIQNMDFKGAVDYRCKNSPKYIFKYIGLAENEKCTTNSNFTCNNDTKKNNHKFETLETNMLWMPTFDNLNDPFEFKALYLDRLRLKEGVLEIKQLETFLGKMKECYLLACFSVELTNNMPMWAHYANNHKGFCVKYKVIDPQFLYPISYEDKRTAIAVTITNFIVKLIDVKKGIITENDAEYRMYRAIFFNMNLMKHRSWSGEKEYRIMYANEKSEKYGDLISVSKLGLEVTNIYTGIGCSPENKKRLKDIASKLNCNMDEMYLDEDSDSFELSYRKPDIIL